MNEVSFHDQYSLVPQQGVKTLGSNSPKVVQSSEFRMALIKSDAACEVGNVLV